MTDEADQVLAATGETPDGASWRLTVRLDGEQREIDLTVVGSGGGGVSGPRPYPERLIDICMIGGRVDRQQHIVGELGHAVERVSIRLDDGTEVDAAIVRSDGGEVDYFVAFAPWAREVIEARAFDRLGQVLEVRERLNIDFWRRWRMRRTKPAT